MSDVSMTAEVAPASAPPPSEVAQQPPEPIRTDSRQEPKPAEKAPEPAEKPKSTRDAVKEARAKIEAREKAEPDTKALPDKAKAEPDKTAAAKPATTDRPRAEHGHFAVDPNKSAAENAAAERAANPGPKPVEPGQEHRAAPSRFSAEAKAAWETAPEHVQKETHRAFRELEQGIAKYREPAQRYETVFKEFDDIAHQSNIPVEKRADVLREYISLDRGLNDPKTFLPTMEKILNGRGVTLQQFAEHVLGRKGEPGAQPQGKSQNEVALERKIAELEQKVGSVSGHIEQQQKDRLTESVVTWSQGKDHFDVLADRIAQIIIADHLSPDDAYDKALTEAQELARTFGGGSGSEPPPSRSAAPSAEEIADQTRRGSKSISGAPSAGSAPAQRPSSSTREAIRKAMQRVN